VSYEREGRIVAVDPEVPDFARRLTDVTGLDLTPERVEHYREVLRHARAAGMPVHRNPVTIDDFFPTKRWRGLAVAGFMLPDPYTGNPGVEQLEPGRYRVTVLTACERGVREVTLTLRLMESSAESRLVFSPLLDRFYAGQDYRTRPVKISDSGRIRNELQTWCSEALEFFNDDSIRVHFSRIDDAVLPPEKREFIRQVLAWYKENHPIWFRWLYIAD